VPLHLCVAWDSLDVARRLIRTERYTLEHLVAHLQIPFQPTHRALDDVLATASLAARLAPLAARHAAERRALMLREAPLFARLRQTLDRWAAEDLRPAQLIARITEEALKHKYPKEPWRLDNLAELVERMTQLDDADLPAATALSRALDRAALVRDVDQLDEAAGVRVITMHQSKGLEFDAVWVPGLTEGGLPSWFATQDGSTAKLDEERRVLYVAITRARRALDLSWAGRDRSNRAQRPSSFLEDLRKLCILDEDAP
jgi:DNA helicase II / ATP-dependent DNA helicase PcrA